jgi:hypothetical protein
VRFQRRATRAQIAPATACSNSPYGREQTPEGHAVRLDRDGRVTHVTAINGRYRDPGSAAGNVRAQTMCSDAHPMLDPAVRAMLPAAALLPIVRGLPVVAGPRLKVRLLRCFV